MMRRRRLARELGADEVLGEQADVADAVREATNGAGADVVLDFVGTDATHESAMQMLARRGLYSIVGYGGTVSHPSVGFVVGETVVAGNLVGNWIDLWELLELHVRGHRASHRDASARGRERRARQAPGRRGHRAGGSRPVTGNGSVQERIFDVRGARVVVTGAAAGSASRWREVLADCGAHVTLADIDAERVEEMAAKLTERGASRARSSSTSRTRARFRR